MALTALWLVIAGGVQGLAQEPKEKADAAKERATEQDMPMGRESMEMDDMANMASAMKSMADMCRMMMEREMQSRPYMIAAGAVIGALALIALVLFIVLEIQWIRFFSVRIKTERQRLSQPRTLA